MSGQSTSPVPPDGWRHYQQTRTHVTATYLTKAETGTQPVADSAHKSAYLREDKASTGGITAARNKTLASTMVGCSHMNEQCASLTITVERHGISSLSSSSRHTVNLRTGSKVSANHFISTTSSSYNICLGSTQGSTDALLHRHSVCSSSSHKRHHLLLRAAHAVAAPRCCSSGTPVQRGRIDKTFKLNNLLLSCSSICFKTPYCYHASHSSE